MTVQQLQQELQGQAVTNVLQTIIAAGVIWMAATVQDMTKTVELNAYRIDKLEQRQP